MDIAEAVRVIQEAPHELQEIQDQKECERIVEAIRKMHCIAITCYVSAPVDSPIFDDPTFSVDGIRALLKNVLPLIEDVCKVRQLCDVFEKAPKRNVHGEDGVAAQLGISGNAVKLRIKALALEADDFRCAKTWFHPLRSSQRIERKYAEAIQWARTATHCEQLLKESSILVREEETVMSKSDDPWVHEYFTSNY